MNRHEPSLVGALLALLLLPVFVFVYYLARLGEFLSRGKGKRG